MYVYVERYVINMHAYVCEERDDASHVHKYSMSHAVKHRSRSKTVGVMFGLQLGVAQLAGHDEVVDVRREFLGLT